MVTPCQLIHASRLAYAISDAGTFQPINGIKPDDECKAAGFDPKQFKIFQSKSHDGIDAGYYGITQAGEGVLAFRGTLPPALLGIDLSQFLRILLDWLNDGQIEQVRGNGIPGLVHRGFLASLDNLWPTLGGFVDPQRPLYITGHSKGGALAFLAAARWSGEHGGKAPDQVCTFAAPRAGNQAFALAYDGAMKALTRRYEYQDDIVPHLPPHTGSWFQMFQGGQAVGAKIAVAASPAALAQKPGFDALLKRVGQVLQKIENHTLALDNYVSVGTLEFIDWADKIQGDSWSLSVRREVRLAELLLTLQFLRIAGDHSSDGGYLKVPCR